MATGQDTRVQDLQLSPRKSGKYGHSWPTPRYSRAHVVTGRSMGSLLTPRMRHSVAECPYTNFQVGAKYVLTDFRKVEVRYVGYPERGLPGIGRSKVVGMEILEDPTGFGGKNNGELHYPSGATEQCFTCHRSSPHHPMGLFMQADDFAKKVFLTVEEYERRDFMDRQMRPSFYALTGKDHTSRECIKIIEQVEDDPIFFSLNNAARQQLNNRAALAKMCQDLHRCIDLIDTHIPKATEMLNSKLSEGEKQIFETHVIQELLRRAQEKKLSHKIRMNFQHSRQVDLEALHFTEEEIEFMVTKIAWIRNNIVASAVTDENDAKMAAMGAKECLAALMRMLEAAESPGGIVTNEELATVVKDTNFKF